MKCKCLHFCVCFEEIFSLYFPLIYFFSFNNVFNVLYNLYNYKNALNHFVALIAFKSFKFGIANLAGGTLNAKYYWLQFIPQGTKASKQCMKKLQKKSELHF